MRHKAKLAVVGFGLVGRQHADVIANDPSLDLTAIVEPTQSAAGEIAELGARHFASLRELLDQTRPDGVLLATPTPFHVEQAMHCVKARVPVLIEKPISTSVADAVQLVALADKHEVPILVGHHRRYSGVVQAAKAAIEQGLIGDICSASATCWFYKPDQYFKDAAWRTRKGAGPISVNLVHDVDLLRHFCGEVVDVQAVARPSVRGFDNEDLASALLSFSSGAIATVSVSDAIVSPWSWEMTTGENPVYPNSGQSCYQIGGSKGALSVPDLKIWQHQDQPDWWAPINATHLNRHSHNPLALQAQHFAKVIFGQASPNVSGLEGLRSLQVVEAIQEAVVTGARVSLPAISLEVAETVHA
ncbi:MAG: Gfo/Idh/MocA family oxidoreductase [Rhizobiaceae bacterium]